MSNRKKILLIGPIADYGGREVEAGFIANILASKYEIELCTTGKITKKSQAFDFNKDLIYYSLDKLALKKYKILRFLALLSYLKSGGKGNIDHYVNNFISKKYFDYQLKISNVLNELIPKYNLVFICAQLSSNLMSSIISIAKHNDIKVIFRTTGTIPLNSNFSFLKNTDLFLHHSKANAVRLPDCNYEVIDQCAYIETKLLNIPNSNLLVNNFLVLSRLSHEKGVEQIIDYFLKVRTEQDYLYLAGNGSMEENLRKKFKDFDYIKILGFISVKDLSCLYQSIDCMIIPSPEESGPLVGIESMAAAKIIISTKVGAMSERLEETLNDFWYDYNNFESFKKAFLKVKELKSNEILTISDNLRAKYLNNYSIAVISEKYLNIVKQLLN